MTARQPRGLLWSTLFRVEPGRPAIGLGLRVACEIAVPLLIGLVTNRVTIGSAAALGALNVGMADSGGPERTRAVAMSVAALADAGAFALGITAASSLGAAVPLMLAIAFAGGLVTIYGRVASNVGFVVTVVFILGLGFPPGALSGAQALWVSLAGGAWAMVLALGLWPLRPYAAAQNAVAGCYVAVARLVAETCSAAPTAGAVTRASRAAREALEDAGATVRATRFGRDGESAPGRVLAALTEAAGALLNVSEGLAEELVDRSRLGDTATPVRSAGERVSQTLRSVGSAVRAGGRPDVTGAESAVRDLGEAVSSLTDGVLRGAGDGGELAALRPVNNSMQRLLDGLRDAASLAIDLHGAHRLVGSARRTRREEESGRPPRLGWWVALTSNLTLDSVAFRHALRYATLTTIGVLIFRGLSLPRGYWVALTIAVILKPYAGVTFQRTLLRVGGTILGALLAVAITATVTNEWVAALLTIPLALVAFSFLPLNYGLWVVFFTPLVILLTEVGHPGQWTLAGWRVADTLIGAALALGGSYLLWPDSSRGTDQRELGAAMMANRAYFCAVMRRYIWPGPTTEGLDEPHRKAALAADNAEADLQRLLGERPGGGALVEQFWSLVGANRRVYSAVTALEAHLATFTGRHPVPSLPELCRQLDAALSELAGALRQGRPPGPLPALADTLGALQDHLAAVKLARAKERSPGDTAPTPLVEEVRDESLLATEAQRLVRAVEAMHSAVAGD
ncbi:MAG TPA: FUSC family protein [Acidimicrobiales bacterium]